MRTTSALVLLLFLFVPMPALADCHVHANDRVVLYGTTDDPDVFVWDSRFRLRDYEGGTFDQMRALLPHATLVRPGTRAMVESCVSDFVQSKYVPEPDDAIGVANGGDFGRADDDRVLRADDRVPKARFDAGRRIDQHVIKLLA